MENEYKKYMPMIKNRAKSWSRKGVLGIEREDLESLGNEVFVECCNNFDPSKGSKFGTWLWHCLNNRFYTEVVQKHKKNNGKDKREIRQEEPYHEFTEHDTDYNIFSHVNGDGIESQIIFKDTLERLSPDAQYIINSALNTPTEMIEQARKETKAVRINCKRIQRHLVENENWAIYRCRKAFKEIRKALTN
ncbi:MAG: sigma factor [Bacteriovoracaceae bacterium]